MAVSVGSVMMLLPKSTLGIAMRRAHRLTGAATTTRRGHMLKHKSSFSGFSLRDMLPSNGSRLFAGAWLDNRAEVEVSVPVSIAWELWSDRENISQWMPWISSVKVLKDDPAMSKWSLKYEAFGQNFEFSWLARNLQPIYHQKIHWRSVDGLPNRGAVRFYPRGSSACKVELTISYEVPEVLAIFASALTPAVESILKADLERFAKVAKEVKQSTSSDVESVK